MPGAPSEATAEPAVMESAQAKMASLLLLFGFNELCRGARLHLHLLSVVVIIRLTLKQKVMQRSMGIDGLLLEPCPSVTMSSAARLLMHLPGSLTSSPQEANSLFFIFISIWLTEQLTQIVRVVKFKMLGLHALHLQKPTCSWRMLPVSMVENMEKEYNIQS